MRFFEDTGDLDVAFAMLFDLIACHVDFASVRDVDAGFVEIGFVGIVEDAGDGWRRA